MKPKAVPSKRAQAAANTTRERFNEGGVVKRRLRNWLGSHAEWVTYNWRVRNESILELQLDQQHQVDSKKPLLICIDKNDITEFRLISRTKGNDPKERRQVMKIKTNKGEKYELHQQPGAAARKLIELLQVPDEESDDNSSVEDGEAEEGSEGEDEAEEEEEEEERPESGEGNGNNNEPAVLKGPGIPKPCAGCGDRNTPFNKWVRAPGGQKFYCNRCAKIAFPPTNCERCDEPNAWQYISDGLPPIRARFCLRCSTCHICHNEIIDGYSQIHDKLYCGACKWAFEGLKFDLATVGGINGIPYQKKAAVPKEATTKPTPTAEELFN